MRTAYIGLGANLGDPARQLRFAVEQIAMMAGVQLLAVSRFYRSPPMGPSDQPDYCNAVVSMLSDLPAHQLLAELLAIERAAGRVRGEHKWGPRELDLDLLHMEGVVTTEPGLRLPHPGIASRDFVLKPLCEVAPGLEIPGVGVIATLAEAAMGAGLRPWFASPEAQA